MVQDEVNPDEKTHVLRYKFYEKASANPKVLDAASAMPHRVKIASMMQEGVRRLCNTSRELGDLVKADILSTFMRKLQLSGYGQSTRANILEGAVKTFRMKERAEALGVQPVHHLSTHNQEQRRRDKMTAERDWYKPGKSSWKRKLLEKEKLLKDQGTLEPGTGSRTYDPVRGGSQLQHHQQLGSQGHPPRSRLHQSTKAMHSPPANSTTSWGRTKVPGQVPPNSRTEAILFVPHTPDGAMAKLLQRAEDKFSSVHGIARVKIVKRGGSKIMDILGKKDPWASTSCARPLCMVMCQHG